MNYYNEFDPKAAAWLRSLIEAKLIPAGVVDQRSITDVKPTDLSGFVQGHFFAGIGGWSRALQLAGWPEDRPVWTGSCPCQPFSCAGKQQGTADKRHLWPEFFRLIRECRPPVVFGEQVASAAGRDWLAGVRINMETLAYAVGAADLCAASASPEVEGWIDLGDNEGRIPVSVGPPHIRQRLYWVADTTGSRFTGTGKGSRDYVNRKDQDTQRRQRISEPTSNSPVGRLANANNAGSQGLQQRRDGSGERPAGSSGLGRFWSNFDLIPCAFWVGHPESDDERRERQSGEIGRRDGEAGRSGAWSNFDLIPCADGKTRRVESGVKPLVNGLPRGVVYSRDSGVPINPQETGEARVMRLRGYGNAIMPELAAEFILSASQP